MFLLILNFSLQLLLAQEQPYYTQSTTSITPRNNVAVISWVGYNDREDFEAIPDFQKDYFLLF